METRKNKLAIILIVLIIAVAVTGGVVVLTRGNTSEQTAEQTGTKEVENKTDMNDLKASEYTNEAFKNDVELGDSKSSVEKAMGKLTKVDIESDEDVYTVSDGDVAYYFYFDGDSLSNVGVYLM